MITLCEKCEAQLLKEVAEETAGNDVSGFYCSHEHAVALVISQDGEVKYTQLSGPVDGAGAAQLMQAFVQELHGPMVAMPAPAESEVRH